MTKIIKKSFNINSKNLNTSLTGFTLVELLAAIAVFFIGILAAFSLSLYNLNTVKENYNRVVAADLAREGIEIIRNTRDSNWLKREANEIDPTTLLIVDWDSGLNFNNFTVDYLNNNLVQLGNSGDTLVDVIALPGAKLYLKNDFYTNDSSAGSQATVFRRVINLQAICLNPAAETENISVNLACTGSDIKIGLQITSRVQYTYGSKTNHIDVVENIYNWRQ